ncbi:MAG: MarR family transcriptional regulator, partial [Clostridia bacterium]|nr:MarR family transcriptional regulator [Clostridia bacterium]
NTRTTAVFFIKYIRTLGFDATNDIFAENAWYFRNALVRANYNNLKENIHETTLYLEKFIRNLLLNESNELKNRYLHIQNIFEEKETENVGVNDKNVGVNVGVKLNKTQIKIVELIRNKPSVTIEEMARFAAVETRTIERNIKKLKEKEIIDRVGADKNGHWIAKI